MVLGGGGGHGTSTTTQYSTMSSIKKRSLLMASELEQDKHLMRVFAYRHTFYYYNNVTNIV